MAAVANEFLENSPEWTDAEGVADFLGGAVPTATIATMARSGRLPSVKIGTRRIFHLPTVGGVLMEAMKRGRSL